MVCLDLYHPSSVRRCTGTPAACCARSSPITACPCDISTLKNQAWYVFNHGRKGDNNGYLATLLAIYFGGGIGIISLFAKQMKEFTIGFTLLITSLPLVIMIIYWSKNPPVVFFTKTLISFLISLIFLLTADKKQKLKID
jgi:hypothetical protein